MNLAAEDLDPALAEILHDKVGAPAILDPEGFASAVCDREGRLIHASPRFTDRFHMTDLVRTTRKGLAGDRPHVVIVNDRRTSRPFALLAVPACFALNLPIDPDGLAFMEAAPGGYVLLTLNPSVLSWKTASEVMGLSAAEGQLVAALAYHGDLQRAAASRNIAHETARKFVASALRKTGAHRQTDLVHNALNISAGELAEPTHLSSLLQDLFALSGPQADLAVLLSHGMTRDNAAAKLGLTAVQTKAALKLVFERCGVASAVDLARIVTKISALEAMAIASHLVIKTRDHSKEVVRLVPRRSREGTVAVIDHGPDQGDPVMIFHAGSSGRTHVTRFITALQVEGFRPISIERSGFGLSTFLNGDPVKTAVEDIADVLENLAIPQARAIALGTFAAVVACAAQNAGVVTGGVMVNPDPADSPDVRVGSWHIKLLKVMALRNPSLVAGFVRLLYHTANSNAFEQSFRRVAQGSQADEALIDDAGVLAEFERGANQAAVGEHGVINELQALGRGPLPEAVADSGVWTILFGAGDSTLDARAGQVYWQSKLPDAHIEILADGGHWVHVSHAAQTIAALAGLGRRVAA